MSLALAFSLSPSLVLSSFVSLFLWAVCKRITLFLLPFSSVPQSHMEERTGFEEILTGVHSCKSPLHLHTRTNSPPPFFLSLSLSLSPTLFLFLSLAHWVYLTLSLPHSLSFLPLGGVGVPYGSSKKWKWIGLGQKRNLSFLGSDIRIYVVRISFFLSRCTCVLPKNKQMPESSAVCFLPLCSWIIWSQQLPILICLLDLFLFVTIKIKKITHHMLFIYGL